MKTLKKGETPPPGFVGYDSEGRFIHYCHCGWWGSFGVGYFPGKGQYGEWFCREHRQEKVKEESNGNAPARVIG